jgi:hypothetical protein
MKFNNKFFIQLMLPPLLSFATALQRANADTHIYAGALGTNQNDKLYFFNGAAFDATLSSLALPQVLRTNGLNTGNYRGDNLTFSALPATQANGGPIGPNPGHAALGAELSIQVVSVDGPPGGSFAFWEGDGESDLGNITFSVPAGTTNGENFLVISENGGVPGTDPYGHIHGREFTTSAPGTYLVGFRAMDISNNGTNGGPIHLPSDVLLVRFQAGLWIENFQRFTNRVSLSFRSPPGISNQLEAANSFPPTNWQTIGSGLKGNNALQTLSDTNINQAARFYRLRQLNNLP